MKKAIVFGAGNIGRGLNAYILNKNNYKITFLDVSNSIIKKVQTEKEYFINTLDSNNEILIDNFDGVNILSEKEKAIECIANSEIIFISIGINNLIKIAPLIKEGIIFRQSENINHNLNIVAVENGVKASSQLEKHIKNLFTENDRDLFENISFSNCAVDRIVPQQENKNLNVDVEEFYELVIDQKTWLGSKLRNVEYSNQIEKYILRKLFMLNGTHTFIAWNGIINKFLYINEFTKYQDITEDVKSLLNEYGKILVNLYGFKEQEINDYKIKIIQRLSNKNIFDDVNRVGRSVIRKISPNERFSLPLKLAFTNKLKYEFILKAISFAFLLDGFKDEENLLLNNEIREKDLEFVIDKYTKLPNDIKELIINNLNTE